MSFSVCTRSTLAPAFQFERRFGQFERRFGQGVDFRLEARFGFRLWVAFGPVRPKRRALIAGNGIAERMFANAGGIDKARRAVG